MCCSASQPNASVIFKRSKGERWLIIFFFFFFLESLEFGIQINRCSGMGAEECLSLSSCLLSREDLQGVSIKELTLVMMGVFFGLFFFSAKELMNIWVPGVCGRIGWCRR